MISVQPNSTFSFAKREAGGKGFNLYLMSSAGLPVPRWLVLGRTFYDDFIEGSGLKGDIERTLRDFASAKISAQECSFEMYKLIALAPINPAAQEKMRLSYESVSQGKLISVRSSAADEDSGQFSFAGQLSSFLYVKDFEECLESVKGCWASAFSERALVYRKEAGISLEQIGVAVVLQEMIDPQKSGVLFTCEPIEEDAEKILVSSVYGVGEGIVSGELAADSYWLRASDCSLLKQDIVDKEHALQRNPKGRGCLSVPVAPERRQAPSLNEDELKTLGTLAKEIFAFYNTHQDVEWAIENGKAYILQSRPVTTLKKQLVGYPNLWDNSNIVESYGGITSPLSFSFALRNYKNVYIQFCEVLHVPSEVIKDMEDYLGNMLGSLNGRVYYNLYNWYKLVGVLPGFKANKEFMETMMGVSEALTEEINLRIAPHPSWLTWKGRWRKFVTGLSFVYFHFRIQSIVDDFLKSFHKDYLHYRSLNYFRMRADQICRVYVEMERNMIGRWKAPIINDFLCMVHFGLLRKLTSKWLAELDSTIQNDLLAGEGNLESAEPTRQLIRLAAIVQQDAGLRELIESTKPRDLLEALNQSRFQDFYKHVLDYIDRFGFRCMNEMKLEEVDLYSDPSYFFVCLKNYLRSGTVDLEKMHEREQELRSKAESKVFSYLTGMKLKVYKWVLKHARKAVKNRENTRFARTRIYGVARSMFQGIGEDFAAKGLIEAPRDIFFLEMDEIFGVFQGTLTSFDLKDLIKLRKAAYARFETEETKPRALSRGPVYWGNPLAQGEEVELDVVSDPNADLQGLPCCPGIVEGVVKVVSSPQDDLELNGEILVTPRTDPGWVPLYPSVSGLLVERGSLLSHSAIVAREMGLPAIVSIKGLTKVIKNGMRIRMDGKKGCIYILDNAVAKEAPKPSEPPLT
jgi:phosphohistidine swiveling domain-containing protein